MFSLCRLDLKRYKLDCMMTRLLHLLRDCNSCGIMHSIREARYNYDGLAHGLERVKENLAEYRRPWGNESKILNLTSGFEEQVKNV